MRVVMAIALAVAFAFEARAQSCEELSVLRWQCRMGVGSCLIPLFREDCEIVPEHINALVAARPCQMQFAFDRQCAEGNDRACNASERFDAEARCGGVIHSQSKIRASSTSGLYGPFEWPVAPCGDASLAGACWLWTPAEWARVPAWKIDSVRQQCAAVKLTAFCLATEPASRCSQEVRDRGYAYARACDVRAGDILYHMRKPEEITE